MIVVRTLGPADVSVNGAAAPAKLLWKKNLALLIYLARSPNARERASTSSACCGARSQRRRRAIP